MRNIRRALAVLTAAALASLAFAGPAAAVDPLVLTWLSH